MAGTVDRAPVVIVYPDCGSVGPRSLGRRLAAAASSGTADRSGRVRLEALSAVAHLDPDWLRSATALVVSPAKCALPGGDGALMHLRHARRRVGVLADHDDADWGALQSATGLELDAIIDVGFVPNEQRSSVIPYTFLYNAPLPEEADQIEKQPAGRRPLPWAVVGRATRERAALADALVRQLSPAGIVFLPSPRPVCSGEGALGTAALSRLLSSVSYYVWCSADGSAHYESDRFLQAVLAGAVPCKIDSRQFGAITGLPTVYASVAELVEAVEEFGHESLFAKARDYYLARGTLGDQLGRALDGV